MSSIGTTAKPSVMTAAQSASARTSVSVSEFCGYASDHPATDAAATTSTPPATGRVMSGAAPPTTHRRR